MAGPAPGDKAHMASVMRLPQRDVRAGLVRAGQRSARDERIVARVEQQGGYTDRVEVRLTGRAAPVVVRAGEAVQRRGETIVEVVQRARRDEPLAVEQSRILSPLGERTRLHGAQEHARV